MSTQRKTQRDRILAILIQARGAEVPSFELARHALQYSARVKELRELGFQISNRTEHRDGQVCGYFRLLPSAPLKAAAAPREEQEPTLFDVSPQYQYPD